MVVVEEVEEEEEEEEEGFFSLSTVTRSRWTHWLVTSARGPGNSLPR